MHLSNEKKMPIWKKILYFTLALTFSLTIGITRFIVAAHSIDQIIFGWMLGAWLAISYFMIGREVVHKHVAELITGQTTSSNAIYYTISSIVFIVLMLTLTVTLLVL